MNALRIKELLAKEQLNTQDKAEIKSACEECGIAFRTYAQALSYLSTLYPEEEVVLRGILTPSGNYRMIGTPFRYFRRGWMMTATASDAMIEKYIKDNPMQNTYERV